MPLTTLQRELGRGGPGEHALGAHHQPGQRCPGCDRPGPDRCLQVSAGIPVSPSSTFGNNTIGRIVEETTGSFSLIIQLLAIMAIIIAVVGGVGLSGVLTLNVLERRREIGVMRSIGASTWRVIRLYVGEGVLLGWLSWLIALPLSIPAGRLMLTAVSQAFGQDYLYHYTPTGSLLWLGIITVLSILASWMPARSATRISVRESLAYQ